MKKALYILLTLLLIDYKIKAQTFNFSGNWHHSTSRTQFTLKLLQTGMLLKGTHASVLAAGNRIDASLDSTDITINGVLTSNSNVAIVTFRSSYSNTIGKAKLTHTPVEIKWEIIQKPLGEYHIPDKGILRK